MDDLALAIDEWKTNREQIILTGDFNTGDKKSVLAQDKFWTPWLQTTGLIDAHRHFINSIVSPSTHER